MAEEKNKSPLYAFGEGKSFPHQRNRSPLNQGVITRAEKEKREREKRENEWKEEEAKRKYEYRKNKKKTT
tara:strand:- start:77 stop:286 length:210 start_codon:yes stop_codon:yes gene_type:complete